MATRKTGFDKELFSKLVAHFDNEDDNERSNAVAQAHKLCVNNGIKLTDGLEKLFGSDGSAALLARIEDLTQENEVLHRDNTTLVQLVKDLKEKTGPYKEESFGSGFSGFRDDVWQMQRARLLCLGLTITGRMWLFEYVASVAWIKTFNWAFIIAVLFLFGSWTIRQYEKTGVYQVFMKWALVIPGYCAGISIFFGSSDWHSWFSADQHVSMFWEGVLVVGVVTIVAMSNFTGWLAETVTTSDHPVFSFLRGSFN